MSINIRFLRLCSTEWKSSLNLAPEMFITKETKWHMFCQCYDISYNTGPVLIKTKISRLKTMCVPSKTLSPTLKGCKWGYSVFYRKIKFTNIWISLKCKKNSKRKTLFLFICTLKSLSNYIPSIVELTDFFIFPMKLKSSWEVLDVGLLKQK